MIVKPELEEFRTLCRNNDIIAISTELTADTETPLSAYVKLSTQKPAFLFESVVGGEQVSRFSFLGFSSSKQFACYHDLTEIKEGNGIAKKISTPTDPLRLIEDEIDGIRYHGIDGHRFSGGAVGYIGYEYANRVEPTIPIPDQDDLRMPLLFFMITELVLIFDHARQTLTICANAKSSDNPESDYDQAVSKIKNTLNILAKPLSIEPACMDISNVSEKELPEGNFSQIEFEKLVEMTKDLEWARDFMNELGYEQKCSTRVLEDNSGCVHQANNCKGMKRARHYLVPLAKVNEMVESGFMHLHQTPTDSMCADIFTKGLPFSAHWRVTHAKNIWNKAWSSERKL